MKTAPPEPLVEVVAGDGRRPLLLLCDHAGNRVPAELGTLGLDQATLARHIAWDIGAAAVTRALAAALGAAAVLHHGSRLVIDPNRRPRTATSIPTVSDGSVVPGNQGIDGAEVARRIRRYFLPYHRTIARAIAGFRRAGRTPAILAVHSFTPRLNGQHRPWQLGVLWRDDRRIAGPLLEALRDRGDLVVGENQPYSGLEEFGFTVEFHAQRARLPHVMLELRQDEIASDDGAARYAAILADALVPVLADPAIHAPWTGPLPAHAPWRSPRGLMEVR